VQAVGVTGATGAAFACMRRAFSSSSLWASASSAALLAASLAASLWALRLATFF